MLHTFRAIYFEVDNGHVIGMVEELPPAVTEGKDLEDARLMLQDATTLTLHVMHESRRQKEVIGDHYILSREFDHG